MPVGSRAGMEQDDGKDATPREVALLVMDRRGVPDEWEVAARLGCGYL
jgi:hypothetical protein